MPFCLSWSRSCSPRRMLLAQAAIRCTRSFSLLCMPGVLLRHLQIMGWRVCGFRGKGILKNHQGLPVSQGSFGKPCLLCSCLQALRKPGSALLHALPSEMICEHPGVPSSTRAASLHSHHVSTGTDLLHLPPPACSSSVRQCGCNGSALVPCIPPAPFVSAARGIGAKCIN